MSTPGRNLRVDAGLLNRDIVLENDVVFGSVNASVDHYRQGAEAMAAADAGWLARLTRLTRSVTGRAPLDRCEEALANCDDDVKVAIALAG